MATGSEITPLFEGPSMPLFNDSSRRERYFHYTLAGVTSGLVFVTLCLAFFYNIPPDGRHVYFSFVLIFMCFSHCILIHWYRQGDVDPKFRTYIYGNTAVIILLCISGISYSTQQPSNLIKTLSS
ncbi:transmembrane protein 243-like isoform X2 [Varroa jacobsoni]|uniref:Transmembrane protein 243 n=1 Tax=Varroa destructor TaxID=109461 RepID=A0A7M7JL55_VARDE|nr:transmembrane protein 243-like [Varroa destructor]XP_022695701.1 transmembrane protein 243-like isoform X2 [Varroa jacobsoni]